jgi:hypothetical protein
MSFDPNVTWVIERLCRVQHEAYELAAIENGWATQVASRVEWDDVPEANKKTMRNSMRAVLTELELLGAW